MIGNDAPPPLSVDFLADSELVFAETSWEITADTTIDTTTMAVNPPQPAGVSISGGKQKDGTLSVTVLRVKDLVIAADVSLTVSGAWPLVILASGEVRVEGLLDVGAHGNKPGPGGATIETVLGAGVSALHGANLVDSGAGGGSFGSRGSDGGQSSVLVSASGMIYPLTTRLVGGASSGGVTGTCSNFPGAGGGALLLYASTGIHVAGAISSGGGGGGGGRDDDCDGNGGAGSGAGGGSGGTLWLQTPQLTGSGVLAANGGGGGGGGQDLRIGEENGENGEDGKPDVSEVARGGSSGGNGAASTDGANGAVEGTPATSVAAIDVFDGNGGGGGGGLGRIVYRAPSLGELQSSPAAVRAAN